MKKILFLPHICLISASIFFSSSINAEMYKWVDEDGSTQYTQSPPPGDIVSETIRPPSKVDTESASQSVEKQKKTADKLRDDRISAKDEKQKTEEEAVKKQQLCEQAKKRHASYQRPRVSVENPDGLQRVIGEDERQSEIKKSQEKISELCK